MGGENMCHPNLLSTLLNKGKVTWIHVRTCPYMTLTKCRLNVYDAGPVLSLHLVNVLCLRCNIACLSSQCWPKVGQHWPGVVNLFYSYMKHPTYQTSMHYAESIFFNPLGAKHVLNQFIFSSQCYWNWNKIKKYLFLVLNETNMSKFLSTGSCGSQWRDTTSSGYKINE